MDTANSLVVSKDVNATIDPDINTFEFTLFPKLPSEIRLMIWALAPPGPRTAMMRAAGCLAGEVVPSDGVRIIPETRKRILVTADPHVPALLLVNRESRAVAQKVYQATFKKGAHRPIYYSPAYDVVMSEDVYVLRNYVDNMLDVKVSTNINTFAIKITRRSTVPLAGSEGQYRNRDNPRGMLTFWSNHILKFIALPTFSVKEVILYMKNGMRGLRRKIRLLSLRG